MPILLFANVLIISFSNLIIPEFSILLASKNTKRIRNVCNTILKIAIVFSIGIGAIFFFFANELSLTIYGSIETAIWIRLLSPLVFFMYVDNIIDGMLKGINEQVGVMLCNILDLVVTILIIYFLVPIIGMDGYILSIFISEILNFIVSIFQLRKRIKFSIKFSYFFKAFSFSVISFLITRFINIPFGVFNVVIKIIVFLGTYTLLFNYTDKIIKKSFYLFK